MGLQEVALAGLGLVLVGGYSSKSGAGEGLSTLGAGVTSLIAAPGVGFGTGLQSTAKGLLEVGQAIGGIGEGFGKWFEYLNPFSDWEYQGPSGSSGTLEPDSGGSGTDNLPGGGGNVPPPVPPPPPPAIMNAGVFSLTGVYGPDTVWTFEGASTTWKTEAAAMKNYAASQDTGVNNV